MSKFMSVGSYHHHVGSATRDEIVCFSEVARPAIGMVNNGAPSYVNFTSAVKSNLAHEYVLSWIR